MDGDPGPDDQGAAGAARLRPFADSGAAVVATGAKQSSRAT
ncbi:hypothetical protein FOHLNKBM_1239 [Methylobacterium longum]|jgi:hypothetical protein|nr:hypothetical protein FOHLNKBM_1239 [Methylobacterium longum]